MWEPAPTGDHRASMTTQHQTGRAVHRWSTRDGNLVGARPPAYSSLGIVRALRMTGRRESLVSRFFPYEGGNDHLPRVCPTATSNLSLNLHPTTRRPSCAGNSADTARAYCRLNSTAAMLGAWPVGCQQLNMKVLMGAPNVVRGGSHSGNVAASGLAGAGLLDILASDYYPANLVQARRREGLPVVQQVWGQAQRVF